MSDQLEQLVDSLLYEGYALYPYTPGATKNSTPTPFGIVWYFLRQPFPIRVFLAYDSFCGGSLMDG